MNKDKPKYVEFFICPKCKSQETVALVSDHAYILWCSCGHVEICDKGIRDDIYDFSTHERIAKKY